MTAKIPRQQAPTRTEELDTLAWVRSVRDAMYAATARLSTEEFIEHVRTTARAVDADVEVSSSDSGSRTA